MFADLVNDEECRESDRNTNRTLWFLVFATSLLVGSVFIADWLWGKSFLRVAEIAVQIGGAAIIAGIVILWCLALLQKVKR
jgi:hypothetical protein